MVGKTIIHYGGGSADGYMGTGIVRPACGANKDEVCYNVHKKDVTCKECIQIIKRETCQREK